MHIGNWQVVFYCRKMEFLTKQSNKKLKIFKILLVHAGVSEEGKIEKCNSFHIKSVYLNNHSPKIVCLFFSCPFQYEI